MKYRRVEDGFLVRLDKGEEVINTLTEFVSEKNIHSGLISGIGAIEDATLGVFNHGLKQYITRMHRGLLEVSNLRGNVTVREDTGRPFIHCHVTLASESQEAIAGHLFQAGVAVTLEVYIKVFEEPLNRRQDPDMGYSTWQL